MAQKDDSIIAKEAQINQLKKRNQELEKFRVVFGFKLQKLSKDLEPKEQEIEDLNVKVRDQEEQLNKHREEHHALAKAFSEKKSIIEGMNKQMKEAQLSLCLFLSFSGNSYHPGPVLLSI